MFGGCPFIHDDIGVLYGVPVMPIEELPKICTCGKPLTYRHTVVFVSQPDASCVISEDVMIEHVVIEFDALEKIDTRKKE